MVCVGTIGYCYQPMWWMTLNRISAASASASAMATASALKLKRCSAASLEVSIRGDIGTPASAVRMWRIVGSETENPRCAVVAVAWVLWSLRRDLGFRLEHGDTGATTRQGTTHATVGGGVSMLHQL